MKYACSASTCCKYFKLKQFILEKVKDFWLLFFLKKKTTTQQLWIYKNFTVGIVNVWEGHLVAKIKEKIGKIELTKWRLSRLLKDIL